MKTFTVFIILIFWFVNSFAQATLEKIWSSGQVFETPESVIFDSERNMLYVANIQGSPWEDDGVGFISKLGLDGKVIEKEWITGISAPKGMGIVDGKLYVASVSRVVEIDIEKGTVLKKYEVDAAQNLNDIDVDVKNKKVYISDSKTAIVYKLENGMVSKLLKVSDDHNINGLFYENGKLFVGSSNVFIVDLENLNVSIFQENVGGIDGIERVDESTFICSSWKGVITIISNGVQTELLNTVDKQNTADIEFIPSQYLLLVPTFFDNQVEAYKIIY